MAGMSRRVALAFVVLVAVLVPSIAQAAVPPVSLTGPAGYITRGTSATCTGTQEPYSESGIVADQYGRAWYFGMVGCVHPAPKKGPGEYGKLYAVLVNAANTSDTFTGRAQAVVRACSIGGCGWHYTLTWTAGTGAYAGARGTMELHEVRPASGVLTAFWSATFTNCVACAP